MLIDICGTGIDLDTIVAYNLNDDKDINGIPTAIVHCVLDHGKHRDIRFEGMAAEIFRAVIMHFQIEGSIISGEIIYAKMKAVVENTMKMIHDSTNTPKGKLGVIQGGRSKSAPGKPTPSVNDLLRESFGKPSFPDVSSPSVQSEDPEGIQGTPPPFPPA